MAKKTLFIAVLIIFLIGGMAITGVYIAKRAIPQIWEDRDIQEKLRGANDQPMPSYWEKETEGVYENKGVSKIEKIVTNYVLTTYCNGIHSVYIKDDKKFNLDNYLGKFVRVRYTYIEETNFDVKCIKAPCEPITERKIVINDIEEVAVSEDELTNYKTICSKFTTPRAPSQVSPGKGGGDS